MEEFTRKVAFENSRFIVYVEQMKYAYAVMIDGAYYSTFYACENKEHGVIELRTPRIMEAIFYVENTDRALEKKPWEWARQSEIMAEAAGPEIPPPLVI